ncbi:hypothetical protein COCON_G00232290 [Conger conger]|uniref:Uncharacterized protein n=1 Tax=Conger conger TaxID=82655 RepID=A0A9Q1CVT3_CONCO|nr:hypothetical protein COCON_G00232290 [Conger conger]
MTGVNNLKRDKAISLMRLKARRETGRGAFYLLSPSERVAQASNTISHFMVLSAPVAWSGYPALTVDGSSHDISLEEFDDEDLSEITDDCGIGLNYESDPYEKTLPARARTDVSLPVGVPGAPVHFLSRANLSGGRNHCGSARLPGGKASGSAPSCPGPCCSSHCRGDMGVCRALLQPRVCRAQPGAKPHLRGIYF